jgi:uncharacterized damage-inducible protein DinB
VSIAETLLAELESEMPSTRRLLERVPTDKAEWKPHPKSFPLGHLAQLVATMPGWLTKTMSAPDLNLAQQAGYKFQKTESLLEQFDQHVVEARKAIKASKPADYDQPWSLKMGDKVLMTLPRGVVMRQHINHLCHHRGQLTVYLRLLDVPIPSIYGPTADEKWG